MVKKLLVSCFLLFASVSHAYAGGAAAPDSAAHHGDGHAQTSAGLPQLDPSSYQSQAFWLVLIFMGLYIVFSRKSLADISQPIKSRAERIRNDLDSAERLKEEVASVQEAYEESLKKAREDSAAFFKEAEDSIKKKSEENTKKFQEDSTRKTIDLEKNIKEARKVAMEDMAQIAADVAAEAAEKIIGVRTDAKNARSVVNSLNKAA